MREVEFSNSLGYPSNWGGGNILVSRVPGPKNKIHIVESVSWFVCLFPGKIKHSLSKAIA